MPYIGRSSNFGVRTRFLYTATASQTTFSGTDTQNLTLSYSDSNFIDVHQNGVLLKVVDDYTATSGTSVVLATGATASDVIEITVYDVFSIANHIKKTGDAMAGALTNIDIDGTELVLDADGDTSITADTDDQIDIRIGGADDFAFKANKFEVQTGSNIDMNGTELILDADGDTSIEASSDDTIQIKIAGSEKLRIDDGGDIIIGKTAQNNTAAGTVLQNDGFASFVRDGNLSLILNRLTDAGTIIDFRKDGTSEGSIAVASDELKIFATKSSTNCGFGFYSNNTIRPVGNNGAEADNEVSLGHSSNRFKDLYLSGGIYVGGTGAANHLDDYEEGTYTPAKNNGGSVSYTQQNGYYIKVGRLVTVYMDIIIDSASGESGSAQITLPFTSQSLSINAYMSFVPWIVDTNFTSSTRKAAGFVNEGVSYMFMYRYNQENNSGYAYANGNVTGRWAGWINYFTA